MTAVSTGRLLGSLLAHQFARWLEEITGAKKVLAEAGAHQGQLAEDILNHFAVHEPVHYRNLEYWIVEPSSERRHWQKETLRAHLDRIRWEENWDSVPLSSMRGIIFSNELLDAFPFHRLSWDAVGRRWKEWGVRYLNGEFQWARKPMQNPDLLDCLGMEFPVALEPSLPEGFILEVSPLAGRWWHQAASRLREGLLMTLDYGYDAKEFLKPERVEGTLRAYYKHLMNRELLLRPGEQDLTGHINFTQLERAGNRAGLTNEYYNRQAVFLTRIAAETWEAGASFPAWDAGMKRQFLTLTHPEHFGAAFKVLVQRKTEC